MSTPLRYNISNWAQLTQCLSNNSRDLFITVSSFIGDTISGQLITVNHALYGTVFACMTKGSGSIISAKNTDNRAINWLTTNEILIQLEKFGFLVSFDIQQFLPGDQLSYLMTLQGLGYDHIAPVQCVAYDASGQQHLETLVVAFDGNVHPEWMMSGAVVSRPTFLEAVGDGTAVNVTGMSEKHEFQWDWLSYVANIQDILDENAGNAPYA